MSTPWDKLLEQTNSGGHFVQLYEADESSLSKNVGRYVWEGLRRGDGGLLITTPEHRELFSQRLRSLGADLPFLMANRQLIFLDAEQTLAQFLVAGQPDWECFERVVCAAIREVRPAGGSSGLRAYGEMVGVLWKARQYAAAIRLEQLWNRLLEQSCISLFCAYAIDLFGEKCEVANLDSVLGAHTHMVPAETDGRMETALHHAIEDILGCKADELRTPIETDTRAARTVMPSAEVMVLWLRKNLPEQADRILARTRLHYRGLAVSDLPAT